MLQQEVRNDAQAWQEQQHIEVLVRNLQDMHIQAQQFQQLNQPANNVGYVGVNPIPNPQLQRMGMEEAVNYVNSVKETCNDRPQIYTEFLEIMNEFRRQLIDLSTVLRRVTLIFDGYPELINGFQAFVPGLAMPNIDQVRHEQRVNNLATNLENSLHIEQVIQQPANNVAVVTGNARPQPIFEFPQSKIEDGLNYLDIVRRTFQDRPQVYQEFLSTMKDFKSQRISHRGVIRKVAQMFDGHPQLIYGFQNFLPPGLTMPLS